MTLRLQAILILFAMFWQTIGMLNPQFIEQAANETVHVALHCQEASHHHHADQSLHLDEQKDSVGHQHADTSFTKIGLISEMNFKSALLSAVSPKEVSSLAYSPPNLEGPLRPPRG